uniref:Uncharacterized protein n=1 Tax=Noctiluca scintillans TaxID=2966 RepID=A0A7S1A7Z9_NOCSC|mmetsp:Transcript_34805/g.92946  ORF Transcript_34805/g.92946 Transcript_34805/m.92946 type:complete len:442 (+) Transcript_34805:77-1402(+)
MSVPGVPPTGTLASCEQGHLLEALGTSIKRLGRATYDEWECDACSSGPPERRNRFHCAACGFDLCQRCVDLQLLEREVIDPREAGLPVKRGRQRVREVEQLSQRSSSMRREAEVSCTEKRPAPAKKTWGVPKAKATAARNSAMVPVLAARALSAAGVARRKEARSTSSALSAQVSCNAPLVATPTSLGSECVLSGAKGDVEVEDVEVVEEMQVQEVLDSANEVTPAAREVCEVSDVDGLDRFVGQCHADRQDEQSNQGDEGLEQETHEKQERKEEMEEVEDEVEDQTPMLEDEVAATSTSPDRSEFAEESISSQGFCKTMSLSPAARGVRGRGRGARGNPTFRVVEGPSSSGLAHGAPVETRETCKRKAPRKPHGKPTEKRKSSDHPGPSLTRASGARSRGGRQKLLPPKKAWQKPAPQDWWLQARAHATGVAAVLLRARS